MRLSTIDPIHVISLSTNGWRVWNVCCSKFTFWVIALYRHTAGRICIT